VAPAALLGYALWRQPRYFGNTAPLVVTILFIVLRAGSPRGRFRLWIDCGGLSVLFIAGIAQLPVNQVSRSGGGGNGRTFGGNAIWNLVRMAKFGSKSL
jgi:hypothetical protein